MTAFDADEQRHFDQVIDTINTLSGYNGTIELSDHIDMGGKDIQNLGPTKSNALAVALAQQSFSASALRPQLEAGGSQPFVGYRQINNVTQREQRSSYLNDLMSSPPSANNLLPTLTSVSGGVQVSIPPGKYKFADGAFVDLVGRTDILSLPAQFTISSISCSGNTVTVVFAAPTGIVAGEVITVAGVTPSSFNGTFTVTSSVSGGTTITYQLDLGTTSGSGGTVQTNGVYYYAATKRQNHLTLFGPFPGDTLINRINSNFDGTGIVVVVVVTASGGQIAQSGGGGSPIVGSPTAGSFFAPIWEFPIL
jgi:hypothetical protein